MSENKRIKIKYPKYSFTRGFICFCCAANVKNTCEV